MGHSTGISLSLDMDEFPENAIEETADLVLDTNGGASRIPVTVRIELLANVLVPPGVQLSHRAQDEPWQARFSLRNNGLATAHVELATGNEEITLSRTVCDIKASKSVRVRVESDLPSDQIEGSEITAEVDGVRHSILLSV